MNEAEETSVGGKGYDKLETMPHLKGASTTQPPAELFAVAKWEWRPEDSEIWLIMTMGYDF